MSKERVLITAALPYANGPIHLGHAVEYIQADIYTRFLKLKGFDAIYCCADDTHGTPIEVNAMKAGMTPETFVKYWYERHVKDFRDILVEFDSYYTTNSEENKKFSDMIFMTLKEKGYIYTKTIRQLYCPKCKRFLPDRFVKGKCPKCGADDQYGDVCEKCGTTYKPADLVNPYCSICKATPVAKDSKHYFFRLSAFSDKLREWLTNKDIQPDIKNYVLSWIDKGLEDWCISRDSPYFGFKIPGEKDKYYYVWLDAPVGYIASTANYCKKHGCSAMDYWKSSHSKIIHFIGKDIAYFHLIFWPAVLMASGFKTPDDVVVHGFLTVNKEKMSKSRGTFITVRKYVESLEPEYLRYHYASNLTHSVSDIDLSFEDFKNRVNNELIGNIANFIYRTLSFVKKYCNSRLGKFELSGEEKDIYDKILKKVEEIDEYYSKYEFREVVKRILEISSLGNRYFQENQPWVIVKTNKEKCINVLTFSANIVKILCIVLKPILPKFVREIEKQLNVSGLKWDDYKKPVEHKEIGDVEIVFRKIDKIDFSDPFSAVDLKVARIVDVSEHPNADKLYILQIDLGKEKRQIVSGLRQNYKKNELKGKNIVVVTNLKHANIRGVKSEGMLLAAEDGKNVGLLLCNDSPGSDVLVEGLSKKPVKEVDIKHILKLGIVAKNGKALYRGRVLKTYNCEVYVDKKIEGCVR